MGTSNNFANEIAKYKFSTLSFSLEKSTLLLKNKCFDTTIYMKAQCFQTNETQHYGKEKCLRSEGWSRERVALIKSLIYAR